MPRAVNPSISVIIPAYNAAATLPACLAALDAQTYPRVNYEIIVVNDGSHDDTAQVAARAGADHVIECAHAGPATARNAGIQVARGDVVLFTDADCVPEPEWITEMLRPLGDPLIAGVKGTYRTKQTSVVARLAQCEFEERYNRLEKRASIDFVDSYAAAFRRDALDSAGGFDPAFPFPNNEDVDLSYRLAGMGYHFAFNRNAVVYHRHVDTWQRYLRLKMRRGYWRMLVYRLHPGKAVADSYTPQTLKLQVALASATALLAFVAAIRPGRRWQVFGAAGAASGILLITAIPFTRLVANSDPGVARWAPVFVLARAAAFAVGVAGGAARVLLRGRQCAGTRV